MKTVDEQKLIQGLFERDEAALQEIERCYASLCRKAAERILGEEESAKECWNDLLLDVWKSIPPFEPRSLKAFLLQRIRQIAITRLRKETARKRGGGELTLALEELEEVATQGGPADELERKELSEAIGRFVKALPEQERTVSPSLLAAGKTGGHCAAPEPCGRYHQRQTSPDPEKTEGIPEKGGTD